LSGAVIAIAFVGQAFAYQVRRFRRAAAVVPELHEGKARADDHAWNRPMPRVTTPTANNSAAR
jgi:hypothetical protein